MFRKIVALLGTIAFALILSACGGSDAKGYPLDSSIACITVHDGARFRSAPYVPSSDMGGNEVFWVEMKDHKSFVSAPAAFTVITQSGVAKVQEYHNGTWYGIRRGDLTKALSGELADKVSDKGRADGDLLWWVNKDRATPGCD